MSALPPLLQQSGVPFDVFIQTLTEQLDKAQAAMALKARVGNLPLTFAVKDVSLDLRAFVDMVNDDVFVKPAGPGESEASTIKLVLTTITRPMIEENAVDFKSDDPKFSLSEALKGHLDEEDQRRLERIGVHTVQQLTELRKTAGADVVARLARMPVNRLQQALIAAAAPRVTRSELPDQKNVRGAQRRLQLETPILRASRLPFVKAAGKDVPIVEAHDGRLVLAPHATQMGMEAEVDFGDGEIASVLLKEGGMGVWKPSATNPGQRSAP